ncbi:hypothetical protein GJAV_G00222480 [Gymnothorax javanicus]|nr:hypothetical protein GJAV_G00222480 [Gymnothorax javanicus]
MAVISGAEFSARQRERSSQRRRDRSADPSPASPRGRWSSRVQNYSIKSDKIIYTPRCISVVCLLVSSLLEALAVQRKWEEKP